MKEHFRNRTQIAKYLKVSRMTLNRWERKLPLPNTPSGSHVFWMSQRTIDDWRKELFKKFWYLDFYQKKPY